MIRLDLAQNRDPENLPPNTFYVGRAFRDWPGSALGNPFKLEEHGNSRSKVLDLYKAWLFAKIQSQQDDDPVIQELHRLSQAMIVEGDITLLCWCERPADFPANKPWCHAEIIRGALVWLHGPWTEGHPDFNPFLLALSGPVLTAETEHLFEKPKIVNLFDDEEVMAFQAVLSF